MADLPPNDNYAIIPHPTQPKLLLLPRETTWTLPQHPYTEAPDIDCYIKELYAIEVTVLSCIYDRYKDDEREDQHPIYALENHSPYWQPPVGALWIDRAALDSLTLTVPEHRAVIETWLAEVATGHTPIGRLPWARIGWYDTAISWIHNQLNHLGYHAIAPIEQVCVRMWSTVLCIPTVRGDVYFKAASSAFAFEASMTRALSALFPNNIPRVLALDSRCSWMLMEDAGKTLRAYMGDKGDILLLEAMLSQFAQVQIQAAEHIDRLKACGCPDRCLSRLSELFEEILADTPALLLAQENGLSHAEFEQLRAFTPQLRTMCAELASYHIPETLHHDDFHPGNIMYDGKDYIFFDWAESALAHPFYSMVIVLRYAKFVYEFDTATLDRLRDHYLQSWTAYESMDRLLEAFALSQRLGILCRAITWHHTVSQVEDGAKWQYEDSMPYRKGPESPAPSGRG